MTTMLNGTLSRIFCACLLTGVAACGGGGVPPGTASADASDVSTSWANAFNSGDAARLAALYGDDARSLPPSGPALVGRGQIESYWRGDIGTGGLTTTLVVNDAMEQNGVLHIDGSYRVSGADAPELAAGQYQQTWQRVDGDWQLQREMWRIDPALSRDIDVATQLTAAWTDAYNTRNVKALVALYADEAVLSTVQEGSFEGRTAIEPFWTRDLGGGSPFSTLTLTDVYLSGELAHLEGEYKVSDNQTNTDGRFVQLWMRNGDGWRIHREMWLR